MRREFVITIDGQERAVAVESTAEGPWRVTLDGREHEVDARQVHPGTWSLLVAGRSYLVDLDHGKQGTRVLVGRHEALATVEDARQKRLAEAVGHAGGEAGGEVVRAPIAGKVVKVLVSAGEEVEAGRSVVVLEAMKMENEIKTERGGAVETVHIEPGQSVETQDALVTLGPAS